jgi:hypothetical protein
MKGRKRELVVAGLIRLRHRSNLLNFALVRIRSQIGPGLSRFEPIQTRKKIREGYAEQTASDFRRAKAQQATSVFAFPSRHSRLTYAGWEETRSCLGGDHHAGCCIESSSFYSS